MKYRYFSLAMSYALFLSACTQFKPHQSFSRGPAALKRIALKGNLLGSNDKGFRYREASKLCLNEKSIIGYNPSFFGECGDLTALPESKLRKYEFANAKLKAVQMAGLDLSGIDFSGADLSFANLRGTNLEGAKLTKVNFKGAGYDALTKGLPFKTDHEAQLAGLVKDGYVPTVAVTETKDEASHEYGDLLTTKDPEALRQEFRTFAKPTDRYHAKLLSLMKEAKWVDVVHFNLVMDVCFYQPKDLKELRTKLEASTNWTEKEELNKQIRAMLEVTEYNNQIFLEGVKKISDLSLENVSGLADRIMPTDNLYQVRDVTVEKIDKELKFESEEELKIGVKVMLDLQAYEKAAAYAFTMFQDHTPKQHADIISIASSLKKQSKDFFLEKALATITKLSAQELHQLADASFSYSSELRARNISKVSDLSKDNIASFITKTNFNDKDTVIVYYLTNIVDKISTKDLLQLATSGYEKPKLLKPFLDKVEDLSSQSIVSFMALVTYNDKDSLATNYLSNYAKDITTEGLKAIASASYEKAKIAIPYLHLPLDLNPAGVVGLMSLVTYDDKDSLAINYLGKIAKGIPTEGLKAIGVASYNKAKVVLPHLHQASDLTPAGVVGLMSVVTHNDKDTLALNYLSKFAKSLTSAELLSIVTAGYEKKGLIAANYLKIVSDLSAANVAALAKANQHNDKDLVIQNYLLLGSTFTSDELVLLLSAGYEKKNAFAEAHWNRIPKATAADIIKLSAVAQYNSKDNLLLNYLRSLTAVTSSDLIGLSKVGYEKKNNILTEGLLKVSDWSATSAEVLMSHAQWDTKNSIAEHYLKNVVATIPTASLIRIANASYEKQSHFKMTYMSKISDFTIDNAIVFSLAVSWDDKNTVLKAWLRGAAVLTTAELLKIQPYGYDTYKIQILMDHYARVSDFNYDNAVLISSKLNWDQKNAVLLNYLNRKPKLTTVQLKYLADISYEKKQFILLTYLDLVSDLSVENALVLAASLTWNDKDTFLLSAVMKVNNLSKENLVSLSNAGYEKKMQIMQAGLGRL